MGSPSGNIPPGQPPLPGQSPPPSPPDDDTSGASPLRRQQDKDVVNLVSSIFTASADALDFTPTAAGGGAGVSPGSATSREATTPQALNLSFGRSPDVRKSPLTSEELAKKSPTDLGKLTAQDLGLTVSEFEGKIAQLQEQFQGSPSSREHSIRKIAVQQLKIMQQQESGLTPDLLEAERSQQEAAKAAKKVAIKRDVQAQLAFMASFPDKFASLLGKYNQVLREDVPAELAAIPAASLTSYRRVESARAEMVQLLEDANTLGLLGKEKLLDMATRARGEVSKTPVSDFLIKLKEGIMCHSVIAADGRKLLEPIRKWLQENRENM